MESRCRAERGGVGRELWSGSRKKGVMGGRLQKLIHNATEVVPLNFLNIITIAAYIYI